MLYALHTLTEKDLLGPRFLFVDAGMRRRMFSLETYDRVRQRMDSASIFPTIDEKALEKGPFSLFVRSKWAE